MKYVGTAAMGYLVVGVMGCVGEQWVSFVRVIGAPGASIAGFAGGEVAGVAVPRVEDLSGFGFATFAVGDAVGEMVELQQRMLLEFW